MSTTQNILVGMSMISTTKCNDFLYDFYMIVMNSFFVFFFVEKEGAGGGVLKDYQ